MIFFFLYLIAVKTQITRPPQNSRPILSTSATLSCGVQHDTTVVPTWFWYFYKQPDYAEQPITSGGRYTITSEGSLIISGVAGEDIGRYKCMVVSAGGNDSRDATLVVIGRLVFSFWGSDQLREFLCKSDGVDCRFERAAYLVIVSISHEKPRLIIMYFWKFVLEK